MSWPLIVNPEAEADLAEAKAYYDGRRDGLGDEFLACVEDVFDRLRQTPTMHAKCFRSCGGPSSAASPMPSSIGWTTTSVVFSRL
jgi:hypothetical protein